MLTRRAFLQAGGLALGGLAVPALQLAAPVVEIRMRSDAVGRGGLVRHTATAYHPRNDGHSLRIPEGAVPWDAGFPVKPGDPSR